LLDLRGNVNTRLAKLDADDYDAIILACAGLDRLGLGARIRARLAPPLWLPAPAQGAIAVECRAGDALTAALLVPLSDAATLRCVGAERAMNLHLHGSCTVPIAAYCMEVERGLALWGLVGDASTGLVVRADAIGELDQPIELGNRVGVMLLERGAGEILSTI
jgi:hydroxymethylbilane synthase